MTRVDGFLISAAASAALVSIFYHSERSHKALEPKP